MKTYCAVLAFSLALLIPGRADYLVQPNDVVAVCGDSITEQHIYSAFIEEYLLMCQPTAGQKIVQFGWSGEQAPAFVARLKTDILPFKPTVATTCYGMNDGHYGPLTDEVATTYRTAQTASIEELKKNGVRAIVLGSAKCVDSYTFKKPGVEPQVYNKTLGQLADIDKEIAAKEGVTYADVYGITLATMKKAKAKFGESYEFAGHDGIHPNQNGHLVMAYAFLKALGCDGAIGTITVDAGLNKAEGTEGQQVVSCQGGTVTVTSTRYPFCLTGEMDSTDPSKTAAVTQFFPFNEELNRFMLVVHGVGAAEAKVTWGATTKEFTGAQLEKGVNLAAEFLVNPFSAQFDKVGEAVGKQEVQETTLSKMFMHDVTQWESTLFPGTTDEFNKIMAVGMAQHDKLFQDAANLVVPITHTIKIEVEK